MAGRAKASVWEIELDDVAAAGLPWEEAEKFQAELRRVTTGLAPGQEAEAWAAASALLRPKHPYALHQLVYYSVYAQWDSAARGPPPYWFPSQINSKETNLGRIMEKMGPKYLGHSYKDPISSYNLFHKLSVEHPDEFWSMVVNELSVTFKQEPESILDTSDASKEEGEWYRGALLNIAECCLTPTPFQNKTDDSVAIIWRDEENDQLPVNYVTVKELREMVMTVAFALDAIFEKGDPIGITMPMTCTAVVVYLAIILGGYVVVSIADSFAAKEIGNRMDVAKAKGIFTQDYVLRAGKTHPLYSRVAEGTKCKTIVIPARGEDIGIELRSNDLSWKDFISGAPSRPNSYPAYYQSADAAVNILFSSGTTGEPKAIPWTQISSMRAGGESWAYLDLRPGEVYCWPTNLGWVIGPIAIHATLLTGATLALYHGSPLGPGFCKFVQDAGVNALGTIPSIVKAWKANNSLDGFDWSKIRTFASSGEASNVDDYLWLTSRVHYKPAVECCGGTELAGSYILGSPLQAQCFGTLSGATMGIDVIILDEQGVPYPDDQPCVGEVALNPIYFGANNRLLNADHRKIYFDGMPTYRGKRLRRHGDVVQRTVGGYYIVHGRADDTMNLGGIKTSSVEIERACSGADENVIETVAVSVKNRGTGPELLVVLAVLKDKSAECDTNLLKTKFQRAIQKNLNPLFKVSFVRIVPEFPRTASNKLLRRVLRDQLNQEFANGN